ncbi:MAG: hypothetical protein HC767_14215 [Akkermansiaceae bacterium]|nr:hypothetical protein [Akkermansiaceae bacterium]
MDNASGKCFALSYEHFIATYQLQNASSFAAEDELVNFSFARCSIRAER